MGNSPSDPAPVPDSEDNESYKAKYLKYKKILVRKEKTSTAKFK